MNKFIKYVIVFFIIDILAAAGFFGIRSLTSKRQKPEEFAYAWVEIDESYIPANFIEAFIKRDAEARGMLPVSIRNFGHDERILKKFRGKNFADPKEAQLRMMFKDMEDWMLVEMKYKDKRDREIQRANLYILIKEEWRVGDSGTLSK